MADTGKAKKNTTEAPPKPQSLRDREAAAKAAAARTRAAKAREARAREAREEAEAAEAQAQAKAAQAEAGEAAAETRAANDDSRPAGMSEGLSAAALGLTKLLGSGCAGGVSPQLTDAITQALVMVLGSGPSIVALDGLMAVQAANGMMYYNAVANQQKTNMLSMAMTAKCVRHMLNSDRDDGLEETIFEDEAQE